MDSKQKTVLLDTLGGIKVEDVEAPEARGSRDDRLPKAGHSPLVRVKTEVVVDSEVKKGRSLERQREIEELKKALEERDTELEVMRRMLAEQIVRNDGSNKRKYDGSAETSEKRVKVGGLEKSGKQEASSWCAFCKSPHSGLCTSKTRRCYKCGEVGHDISGCKNPPLCFACRVFGHISSECTKKEVTGHVVHTGGKAGYEKGECSGHKDVGKHVPWCIACKTRHSGPCSLKTMKCRRCGEIGHEWSKCENPPMCYNCRETGHISKECPKEKMRLGRICYSCRGKGHLARDCPKEKI